MATSFDLKQFRQLNGMTQRDVSRILDVSTHYVSAIENGDRNLTDEKLELLLSDPQSKVLPGGFEIKAPDFSNLHPLTAFRRINRLTQKEVADFLGVKTGYISLMETGRSAFSEDKVRRLINNEYGWDADNLKDLLSKGTTVTVGDFNIQNGGVKNTMNVKNSSKDEEIAVLKERIAMLERIVADKDAVIADKNAIIDRLLSK